jgi:hypothetical protein
VDGTLLELIPLVLGAAAVPLWIIVTLLLLRGDGGVGKAAAFLGGATVGRLLQGILFGGVVGTAAADHPEGSHGQVVSVLLLLLGIILLVAAAKKWLKEVDPDEPPPQWMATINAWSPLKACAIGFALIAVAVKQWVFTLSAIGVIGEAGLGRWANVALYLGFTVAAQLFMLLALALAALAPAQADKTLAAAQGWLERNNRMIMIAVSLIFGVYFLWKGATGLLG